MAKRSETKRLNEIQKFVLMLTLGPATVRNDVEAVNKMLGFNYSLDDEDVQRIIAEQQGQVPNKEQLDEGLSLTEPVPEASQWTEKLTELPTDTEGWCKLAGELKEVYKQIAMGTLKGVTSAQSMAIRSIFDRCYGKVVEKKQEKAAHSGVVLLPVLGAGMHSMICPRCGYEQEQEGANGKEND